jgi:hypothetical protein
MMCSRQSLICTELLTGMAALPKGTTRAVADYAAGGKSNHPCRRVRADGVKLTLHRMANDTRRLWLIC